MTKEKLTEIFNAIIEKPSSFHFVCYGGSSIKMIDTRSDKPNFECKHQGDKSWMTPSCENCKGLIATERTLNDYQQQFNSGVEAFYNKLLQEKFKPFNQEQICFCSAESEPHYHNILPCLPEET
ncbi:MAG: hypothetical protein WC554_09945 [Clostridia bacterium]